VYDRGRITYSRLLEVFGRNHDPLTVNAQFCDVGSQCSPAIFVHDEMQRRLAEESKRAVAQQLQKPVVTDIVAATQFWPAEDCHQDYYKKNLIVTSSTAPMVGGAASGATLHQLAGGGLPGASPLGRFNRMHDSRATVASRLARTLPRRQAPRSADAPA